MATSATKTFVNYKEDLLSFSVANERFIGLFNPGRIAGFDTLYVDTPGLTFGLSHEVTGFQKVEVDGTTETDPTGIVFTRQGTIAHMSEEITGLVVPSNAGNSEETVSVVYFQHAYQSSTTPDLGIFGVITGTAGGGEPDLTLPMKQTKLGIITMPGEATTVEPDYWEPARVSFTGGIDLARKTELDDLEDSVVTLADTQTITGDKTFMGDVLVNNPIYLTDDPMDTGKTLNNQFLVRYTPGTPSTNDYLNILKTTTNSNSQINGIIMIRMSTGNGNSYMKVAFSQRGNSLTSTVYLDLLEYYSGDVNCQVTEDMFFVAQGNDGSDDCTQFLLKPTPIEQDIFITILHWDFSKLSTGADYTNDNYILLPWIQSITWLGSATIYNIVSRTYPLQLSKTVNLINEELILENNAAQASSTEHGYRLALVPGVTFYEIYVQLASGQEDERFYLSAIDYGEITDIAPGYQITVKLNGLGYSGAAGRSDYIGTNRRIGMWYSGSAAGSYLISGKSLTNTQKIYAIANMTSAATPGRNMDWDATDTDNALDYKRKTTTGLVNPIPYGRIALYFPSTADPADNTTYDYDPYIYSTLLYDGHQWQEIIRTIGHPERASLGASS